MHALQTRIASLKREEEALQKERDRLEFDKQRHIRQAPPVGCGCAYAIWKKKKKKKTLHAQMSTALSLYLASMNMPAGRLMCLQPKCIALLTGISSTTCYMDPGETQLLACAGS